MRRIQTFMLAELELPVQVLVLGSGDNETPLNQALFAALAADLDEPRELAWSGEPAVLICLDSVRPGSTGDAGSDRRLAALDGYLSLSARATAGCLPPPLILTEEPALFRTDGFEFPEEFVFDLRSWCWEDLRRRLHSLAWLWSSPHEPSEVKASQLWQERNRCRFHLDLLRDFLVGHVRWRLGLDTRHHDARSPLIESLRRLKSLAEGYAPESSGLRELRGTWACLPELTALVPLGPSPLGRRRCWPSILEDVRTRAGEGGDLALLGLLFEKTLKRIHDRANGICHTLAALLEAAGPQSEATPADRDVRARALVSAVADFEAELPIRSGSFGCNLPSLPAQVLMIDDHAQEVKQEYLDRQRAHPAESDSTRELQSLWQLHVAPSKELLARSSADGTPLQFITEGLHGFLQPTNECSAFCDLADRDRVDLVLLDLSMGEKEGEEVGGLSLLRILRGALHHVPVLIFSSFENLRYVIQAVRQGAAWYCRKSNPGSVLRSILESGYSSEWRREASRLLIGSAVYVAEGKDGSPFTLSEGDEYLLRKVTGAPPGSTICCAKLGGGIGGAKTLRVSIRESTVHGPGGSHSEHSSGRAPIVVKIDRPFRMLLERERFRQFVSPFIPNRVGRIDQALERAGRELGAIAYSFSGLYHGRTGNRMRVDSGTLEKLLDRKAVGSAEGALRYPFSYFLPMLEELFDESLALLHAQETLGPRTLWRARAYGECRSLRESIELRLPVDGELELLEIGPERQDGPHDRAGNEVVILSCYVEDVENDSLTVVSEGSAADRGGLRTYRYKLRGHLAEALAKFRALRPLQHLSVRGRPTRTREQALESLCQRLLEGKDIQNRAFFPERKSWNAAFCESTEAEEATQLDAPALDSCIGTYPYSAVRVEEVLRVLEVAQDRIGIVHGDLNLGNILVEEVDGRSLIPQPWLIDFARTRRDAIAHDFVELEVDLVTRLLAQECFDSEWRESLVSRVREFLGTFNRTPLDFPLTARRDNRLAFFFEAVTYIRRKAAEAGVLSLDYQALLYFYYLIVQKISAGSEKRLRESLGQQRMTRSVSRLATFASASNPGGSTGSESPGREDEILKDIAGEQWRQLLCALGGWNAYRSLKASNVRLSLATVAQIARRRQGGGGVEYLLARNSTRANEGRDVFTPIGGRISLTDSHSKLLEECGVKRTGDGRAMKMHHKALALRDFESAWVEKAAGEFREGIATELLERLRKTLGLVAAQEIVNAMNPLRFIGTVCDYDLTDRIDSRGELTRRCSTVFATAVEEPASISPGLAPGIGDGTLVWVSAEEIAMGRTSDGRKRIGANARALLRGCEPAGLALGTRS